MVLPHEPSCRPRPEPLRTESSTSLPKFLYPAKSRPSLSALFFYQFLGFHQRKFDCFKFDCFIRVMAVKQQFKPGQREGRWTAKSLLSQETCSRSLAVRWARCSVPPELDWPAQRALEMPVRNSAVVVVPECQRFAFLQSFLSPCPSSLCLLSSFSLFLFNSSTDNT